MKPLAAIVAPLACMLLTAGAPQTAATAPHALPVHGPEYKPTAASPRLRSYQPGQVVPDSLLRGKAAEAFFTVQPIPDTIFALMQGKSYKASCPVRRSELRYVRCLHRNLEGQTLVGELVVNGHCR